MLDVEQAAYFARIAAIQGKKPHEILWLIAKYIRPTEDGYVPYVLIEACLVKAFRIPLRVAREIEIWKGLSSSGQYSNDDIDNVLSPWIEQVAIDSEEQDIEE